MAVEAFPLGEAALLAAIQALVGERARVAGAFAAPQGLAAKGALRADASAWLVEIDGPAGPARALVRRHVGYVTAPWDEPLVPLSGGWACPSARLACLGVGADTVEVALLPPGETYGASLRRLADEGLAYEEDLSRATAVGEALATLHRAPLEHAPPPRPRRMFEGSHGVLAALDALPQSPGGEITAARLLSIERAFAGWRWRAPTIRLPARVHGGCTPDAVVLDGSSVHLVPSTRRGVGEPAEDVATLALALLAVGIDDGASWSDGLFLVWRALWSSYLAASGDHALLDVAPPFLAWRALVLAAGLTPGPRVERTRLPLVAFAERCLEARTFDPDSDAAWLGALRRGAGTPDSSKARVSRPGRPVGRPIGRPTGAAAGFRDPNSACGREGPVARCVLEGR